MARRGAAHYWFLTPFPNLIRNSSFAESEMGRGFVLSADAYRITLRHFVSPPGFQFRSVGRLVGCAALYEFYTGSIARS